MKKFTAALVAISFLLTGCSFSFGTKTTTYVYSEEGFESEIILEHSGNVIKKETIINTIDVDSRSEMREYKEYIEEYSDEYNDVDGITHEATYEDDQVVETLVIDFKALDFDAAFELDNLGLEDGTEDGVGLKETVEMLEDEGYKKKD